MSKGPTTAHLDAEVKILRSTTQSMGLELREVATQVKTINATVRLVALFVLGGIISGLISSVWWGASTSTKLDNKTLRMEEKFQASDLRLDKIDGRFDKIDGELREMKSRFDRLESSMDRLLEQTKPGSKQEPC